MKVIDLVIKDNYKKVRPEFLYKLKETIIEKDCPSYYGYENKHEGSLYCRKSDCVKCWNAETEEF